MSSVLQTISLQLIGASEQDYPLLTKYSKDKVFKRNFRTTVASDLKINLCDVKADLTAFSNGKRFSKNKHPSYIQFQEESDRLRRAVTSQTALYNTELLELAISQSNRVFPDNLDWTDTAKEVTYKLARDKSSVFFFIWTWYERLIRQAMLTVLKDGIEVHDAVYSKQDIPVEIVETAILEQTKFRIIIEKD